MSADPEPDNGRAELLDAAIRLLGEHGPEALRARRVTAEIGASTMALYSRYGGLAALVDAVAEAGFDRLARVQEQVPGTADPVADIMRLGLGYRQFAERNKHLYAVMFGLTSPGGHRAASPDPAAEPPPERARAYQRLIDAARRAIDAGRFEPAEPAQVAVQFWTFLHGYVTLELAGYFPAEHGLPLVLRPMTVNLCVGLGDTRTAADASMADLEAEVSGDTV